MQTSNLTRNGQDRGPPLAVLKADMEASLLKEKSPRISTHFEINGILFIELQSFQGIPLAPGCGLGTWGSSDWSWHFPDSCICLAAARDAGKEKWNDPYKPSNWWFAFEDSLGFIPAFPE